MRWRLRRFFYTLLVLVVILLVAFLMLRSRYREIVTELAETQVKNATSDLTNDAIAKQIANGTIQYDRIVYFEKNLDGRIRSENQHERDQPPENGYPEHYQRRNFSP